MLNRQKGQNAFPRFRGRALFLAFTLCVAASAGIPEAAGDNPLPEELADINKQTPDGTPEAEVRLEENHEGGNSSGSEQHVEGGSSPQEQAREGIGTNPDPAGPRSQQDHHGNGPSESTDQRPTASDSAVDVCIDGESSADAGCMELASEGCGYPIPVGDGRTARDPNACEAAAPRPQEEPTEPGGEEDDAGMPVITRSDFAALPFQPADIKFEEELLGFGYEDKHTNMYADVETQTLERTLLGHQVEIRAIPAQFHWNYGDGVTRVTYDPGSPISEYVPNGSGMPLTNTETTTSHVYEETGIYAVTLETLYLGEYRVDGGEWTPIPGSVLVDSSPGEADIWTQNSRWVSGACESQDQWGCNGPVQFDPSTDRPPKIYQDQYDENGNWIGPAN